LLRQTTTKTIFVLHFLRQSSPTETKFAGKYYSLQRQPKHVSLWRFSIEAYTGDTTWPDSRGVLFYTRLYAR